MKTQELIKILKKHGCFIRRHGSNHDIWYSKLTQTEFPVPRHKADIPAGTLNNILKSAGIK